VEEKDAAEECLKLKVDNETRHYFRSFAVKSNTPFSDLGRLRITVRLETASWMIPL
jgi:hypothetical protein